MGGSGGGGWRRISREDTFNDVISRSQQSTDQAAYETNLDELLSDYLADFNSRDVEGIRQHLQTIEDALGKDIEGSMQLLFGGSISKHTYVNGLSDVDMLVCINESSLEGKAPSEVMAFFSEMVSQRLPKTEISMGDLAVTVKFSDKHKIQLLPAIRTSTGFRIAVEDGSQWSNVIRPRNFSEALTNVNRNQGGNVIPLVKIAKAMNNKFPKPSRLSGYHIEALAVDIFNSYSGRQTLGHMLRHFWSQAENRVRRPIADTTGQSNYSDDYLGNVGSNYRRRVSNAIRNLRRRIDMADNIRSAENWEGILE